MFQGTQIRELRVVAKLRVVAQFSHLNVFLPFDRIPFGFWSCRSNVAYVGDPTGGIPPHKAGEPQTHSLEVQIFQDNSGVPKTRGTLKTPAIWKGFPSLANESTAFPLRTQD